MENCRVWLPNEMDFCVVNQKKKKQQQRYSRRQTFLKNWANNCSLKYFSIVFLHSCILKKFFSVFVLKNEI